VICRRVGGNSAIRAPAALWWIFAVLEAGL
jgi:hypothetical protein